MTTLHPPLQGISQEWYTPCLMDGLADLVLYPPGKINIFMGGSYTSRRVTLNTSERGLHVSLVYK